MTYSYVGFEGPIGAGKTTLATLFAAHTNSELVLEDFQGNAFLADFYTDRPRWALPMQLSFLAARHEQLLGAGVDRSRSTVADYTYAKDAMFARLLLKQEREWRLYDRIRSSLSATVPQPDTIVYLDAPNEVLLGRIRQRGHVYERSIDAVYLNDLRSAYETNLLSNSELNIVCVDTSQIDIRSESDLRGLYRRILSKA